MRDLFDSNIAFSFTNLNTSLIMKSVSVKALNFFQEERK